MSVDIPYMRRSIDAAFRLALRDEGAWSVFDLTAEGFFRSFAAIFAVIPLNIVIDILRTHLAIGKLLAEGKTVTGGYDLSDAVFSTATLFAEWLIFPVAMIFVLRFLGLARRYSALIIAHNWGTVVVALLNIPAYALYAIGLVGVDQALDLTFIVLGLTLYYRFYIAQTALDAGWNVALSITCLSFVLQIYFLAGVEFTAGLWLASGS